MIASINYISDVALSVKLDAEDIKLIVLYLKSDTKEIMQQ